MPQWLNPGRYADRVFLRAVDVSESIRSPSAYVNGFLFGFLDDALEDEEGMTESARDAARYVVRFGYSLRLVEEAERTARELDAETIRQLEQARAEFPARHKARHEAALAESESEFDRAYLERFREPVDGYEGEIEIIEQLVNGEPLFKWFKGRLFFTLSGYSESVWRVIALKATQAVNSGLGEENPTAPRYPWEAVDQFLRLGYVLRCGDAFIGYVPERIEGGDWDL
jgi:hypothetical protein